MRVCIKIVPQCSINDDDVNNFKNVKISNMVHDIYELIFPLAST